MPRVFFIMCFMAIFLPIKLKFEFPINMAGIMFRVFKPKYLYSFMLR